MGLCPNRHNRAFRPEACRGPHLYQMVRPEVTLILPQDLLGVPSRDQVVQLDCVDVLDLIIPSASTQTS